MTDKFLMLTESIEVKTHVDYKALSKMSTTDVWALLQDTERRMDLYEGWSENTEDEKIIHESAIKWKHCVNLIIELDVEMEERSKKIATYEVV